MQAIDDNRSNQRNKLLFKACEVALRAWSTDYSTCEFYEVVILSPNKGSVLVLKSIDVACSYLSQSGTTTYSKRRRSYIELISCT